MTNLSRKQLDALAEVRSRDIRWREEKTAAVRKLREEAAIRVAVALHDRDLAVRRAFELDIPKRRIGESLGTSAPSTINDSLERTHLYRSHSGDFAPAAGMGEAA